MSDEWREEATIRIKRLQMDRQKILDLDSRLRYQDLVSEADRHIFYSAVEAIDREIEALKFDLILDEMLACDLPLDEFLKKFDKY